MVVASHTSPFYDINEDIGYIATKVLTQIAVPFFFLVSGYFYIKKISQDTTVFRKYLLRILKTYAVWSCLYYLVDFLKWGHTNLKGFVAHCFYSFTVSGSHYHFWFFPALIVSMCIVTFVYRGGLQRFLFPISIILYIIGCMGCSYSVVGLVIPGLSWLYKLDAFLWIRRVFLMGFPFFTAGIAIDWIKNHIDRAGVKTQVLLLVTAISVWLIEIVFINLLDLGATIIITFGLYPLVTYLFVFLLLHPGNYGKTAAQSHISADWTYYAHPLVIIGIQKIFDIFGTTVGNTLLFLLTLLLTLALYRILACMYGWLIRKKCYR